MAHPLTLTRSLAPASARRYGGFVCAGTQTPSAFAPQAGEGMRRQFGADARVED
jgi:hypothetical protein